MWRHSQSSTIKFIEYFYDLKELIARFYRGMGDVGFTLLYGSQTGQAKAIAEEIYEQSEGQGLKAKLLCLSTTDKKFSLERESLVVFVVSTTGDGEPPDTVGKFWRRLRKKTLTSAYLSGLRYTILGLGDSNYTNFCNCSKSMNSRLQELGATHFYSPEFADDAVGLEVVVEPWIEGLWPALKKMFVSSDQTEEGDNKCEENGDLTDCKLNDNQENNICGGTVESPITDKTTCNDSVSNLEERVLTASLRNSLEPLSSADLSVPVLPAPYLCVEFHHDVNLNMASVPWQDGAEFPGMASPITLTTVVSTDQMTRGDAVKKSLTVTFDTGDTTLEYKPGDSFGIICPNDEKEVTDLIDRLGYKDQADTPLTLTIKESSEKKRAKTRPEYIPELCTIRHALSTCLEIRTVPRKAFLRVLCEYTSDYKEKRRLQELCSKQGAMDYSSFIREPHVSFIDIINTFPSCKPPFQRLLEHLPRLLPRPYSVTCSPFANPKRIRVVFNIIKFASIENTRSERHGLCTGWLEKLTKTCIDGDKNTKETVESGIQQLSLKDPIQVNIFRRNSTGFHLPDNLQCPMIMIGPGTGVAPFIGFLQHREYLQSQCCDGKNLGEAWLFYGCRHKDRDFLFRKELTAFENKGVLTKLVVSYSRDNQSSSSGNLHTPKYVQDNIRIWGENLCDIIYNCGAYIYVCGDAKNMAKNVLDTFVNVLENVKGMEHSEAQKEIWRLRQEHRYVEDVWT